MNEGYSVALVARRAEYLNPLVKEIKALGGDVRPELISELILKQSYQAIALPIDAYNYQTMAKVFRDVKAHWPEGRLKVD